MVVKHRRPSHQWLYSTEHHGGVRYVQSLGSCSGGAASEVHPINSLGYAYNRPAILVR